MSVSVPIETVERDLQSLLGRLRLGETITLISPEGNPLALLVSLRPASSTADSIPDWDVRWDALARRVSLAWKSPKSAVETLTEMRR
jgi:antitoxin (DNA-binding transcriptional repressor) of toxin-antitoxin stability system